MKIALKVDVDTYRGTREGVPALLKLFQQYQVNATFLFSLGPDHTGRALRRIFRPGFLKKVSRTSVTKHYGYKTLMYGVLLPGPHIGRCARDILRDVATRGHEVGIHCYDHVRWQDFVSNKNFEWTRREMQKAYDAFVDALGQPPTTVGAAGWQVNAHVFSLEQTMGFRYASDVRGIMPFFPVSDGKVSSCLQIPTTLPTLDELIGCHGVNEHNAYQAVNQAILAQQTIEHVYTLHAELEGMKLLSVMDRLLDDWTSKGYDLVTMQQLYEGLNLQSIPRKTVSWKKIDGRSGELASEGCLVAGI